MCYGPSLVSHADPEKRMFRSLLPLRFFSQRELLERSLPALQQVSYERMRAAGFNPSTIVDIGAYHGEWTRTVSKVFPSAQIVMIEAMDEKRPILQAVAKSNPGISVKISLLGRSVNEERQFSVMETGSSLYAERSDALRSVRLVKTQTLDSTLSRNELRGPIFVKIDTQGAELEILLGATETLLKTEVVQLELALLPYNEGAPLAADVIAFMDRIGFKLFDINSFVRPNGRDLAQIDALFARENSSLRPNFFEFNHHN